MTTEWTDLPTLQDVAKAQADGLEIECLPYKDCEWGRWLGCTWEHQWKYRARPRQPKMKTVKMLAYLLNGQLVWYQDNAGCPEGNRFWIRVPGEDRIIEILDSQ